MTTIKEAIGSLTIEDVAAKLGLPESYKVGGKYLVPWREDRNPSLSVFKGNNGHTLAKDMSQDDTVDALGFYARTMGMERTAAVPEFMEMAGSSPTRQRHKDNRSRDEKRRGWPDIQTGTPQQWRRLAELRGVSFEAVEWGAKAGLVGFAIWRNWPAWIILDRCTEPDGQPMNAQARRMDGKEWWKDKKGRPINSHTLPGAKAGHMIGLSHLGTAPNVLVVEGGPDLLAGLHFIHRAGLAWDWAILAILGAGQAIQPDEAAKLAGRRVMIVPDVDKAGQDAAERWARSLYDGGAEAVETFELEGFTRRDGAPVGDLCDLANSDHEGGIFS